MNRRSYLKGFGLGVIVSCLILMIAFKLNTNISDEEVIKRAKELGFVESSALVSNVSYTGGADYNDPDGEASIDDDETDFNDDGLKVENSDDNENEDIKGVDEDASDSQESKKDNEKTGEGTSQNEEEIQKENGDSGEETVENKDTSESIEEDKEQDQKSDEEVSQFIVIEIRSGESSETVSLKVKDAGLTENAGDFNRFLCNNGYDKIMRVGKHEIPVGASEEEIAKILSGKN